MKSYSRGANALVELDALGGTKTEKAYRSQKRSLCESIKECLFLAIEIEDLRCETRSC